MADAEVRTNNNGMYKYSITDDTNLECLCNKNTMYNY